MTVIGADKAVAGIVNDVWVDRSEIVIRYLEVSLASGRSVLVPINFTRISGRQVKVQSILAAQFAHVPLTRKPNTVTALEEDKIMAYYGGGSLYATPGRQEPLL